MRSSKIRENVDPKPFIRTTEAGTYCLMGWDGPCSDAPSVGYVLAHWCKMTDAHKSRHQCSCGVSKMRQPDDPEWADV